jgi:hypothetical protein
MKNSRSRTMRRGLVTALGLSTLVALTGTSGAAERATGAAPVPGITATTVTVGSISDISSPVPGLFE